MGKEEREGQQQREQPTPAEGGAGGSGGGGRGGRCSRGCCGAVRPQCAAALLLGAAVALSALFLLPPFVGRGDGRAAARDPSAAFAADIVASFMLQKTVSELSESTSKLEFDIYEEVGVPNSTVTINFLQPLGASNWTNVIFTIVPYPVHSTISPTWLSILRSSFMSLVVEQSTLHLTESLFGASSNFEVFKFPGGITIIPPQAAFLLQKPYASFNFTLNFPIYKVQEETNELKDQMKSGLRLNPYENLYIKLTNSKGSTVAPPTIVQASIVLEVGNHQPSLPRMKQLAQTIANSSSGNLGLNHTVFGRVKQISLSSYLTHSLHSGGGTDTPSPAPIPYQDHPQHHHHHHHHHHEHHHHNKSQEEKKHFAPSPAPVHSPVQQPKYISPSPSCPYGYTTKPKNKAPVAPAAEPVASNHHYASPATIPHAVPPPSISPTPSFNHSSPNNPRRDNSSPAPSPALAKPHLRGVPLVHGHHHAQMPAAAPGPHSSYATRRHSCHWTLALLMYMLMGLP
ncbi:uncharacterized protein LOC8055825 [Sorghum bicolor]|uniref:DUF7036 domain-containing protein n=1 Tax=Sorghum bicolor TaxID=4558 RepID=A0A1B6P8N1_SORBI|nr:uncharacterized protein LOC8055825 [Sorghum bicolor]KXG21865.1 hypothetical protein SORBI_3009G118500 [Sorghum bicolor]OQU77889.1 hypothetical protein SORBI_3009G118500 [Sorghum bicolor]|eukprot:XP_002440994.2 uncharacterized protein LOC8055825 [Sorghum bicolor]